MLSVRLRIPAETMWAYHRRNRGGGPSFDRLVETIPLMPDSMADDTLTTLTQGISGMRFYRAESAPIASLSDWAIQSQATGLQIMQHISGRAKVGIPSELAAIRDLILLQRRQLDGMMGSLE